MLWVKAFHIIFMVTWFTGLFYLPRLFVYHCDAHDVASHGRFCTMERRLLRLMTIGALFTVALGILLWVRYWGVPGPNWLHLKFSLTLALLVYHGWLWQIYRDFANYRNKRNARFYRYINELPTLFLIAMVLFAVLKPF
ncbi:MAG: CopD family protein [Hydrocarboniphaga effusa]|nr:CopD family protein [Hydrocarboniphaga effusa]